MTIAKNAFYVFVGQVATNLVSFATIPLLTRTLGPSDYGRWWVACSISSMAALFIDCGMETYGSLAAARDHTRARELIGTAAVLRVALAVGVALPLWGVLLALRYDATMQTIVFLLYGSCLLAQLATGGMAVIKGLERMGWPAGARVGTDTAHAALLVVALWAGARLVGISAVEILGAGIGLILSIYLIGRLGLWPPRVNLGATRELLVGGAPFLLWAGILVLQPGVESVLLSRLASNAVAGWYGASTKLIGVLLFPASILGAAYTPSLARLHASDEEGFRRMALESLRVALLLGTPIAVGTCLFASQGVSLVYGATGFTQAADNLRILSAFLLLVFVNIPLGSILIVSGRQLPWTLVKGALGLLGAGASYLLIPYFQSRWGNGGLAAAAATVAGEVGMLIAALALLPRAFLEGRPLLDLARVLAASAAMMLVARLLGGAPFPLAMGAALLAYAGTLFGIGGIRGRDFIALRDTVRHAVGVDDASR